MLSYVEGCYYSGVLFAWVMYVLLAFTWLKYLPHPELRLGRGEPTKHTREKHCLKPLFNLVAERPVATAGASLPLRTYSAPSFLGALFR